MSCDLAVIFDVAGTMLEMYRVAKDLSKKVLVAGVITTELVMEKGEGSGDTAARPGGGDENAARDAPQHLLPGEGKERQDKLLEHGGI